MTVAKPPDTLVEAIDKTAFKLLRKIAVDDTITQQDSAILTEQVKAFGEIVKWAQARPSLIPKEDARDAKFAGMKEKFHESSRTPRGRRGAGSPAIDLGSVGVAADESDADAGTGEDDD